MKSGMLLMQEASNETSVFQSIARGDTFISSVVMSRQHLLLERDQCMSWFLSMDDRSGREEAEGNGTCWRRLPADPSGFFRRKQGNTFRHGWSEL